MAQLRPARAALAVNFHVSREAHINANLSTCATLVAQRPVSLGAKDAWGAPPRARVRGGALAPLIDRRCDSAERFSQLRASSRAACSLLGRFLSWIPGRLLHQPEQPVSRRDVIPASTRFRFSTRAQPPRKRIDELLGGNVSRLLRTITVFKCDTRNGLHATMLLADRGPQYWRAD